VTASTLNTVHVDAKTLACAPRIPINVWPSVSFIFDALQLCCKSSMARCVVCRLSVHLFFRHGCIVAKRCKIGSRLLLITNRKSHIGFQITRKSLTLDDLEGQYCKRNCIGYSAYFLATAGYSCSFRRQYGKLPASLTNVFSAARGLQAVKKQPASTAR